MRRDLRHLSARLGAQVWHRLTGRAPPPRPFRFPVPEAPDRARFAAEMAAPPADLGYVIHFTPRSGSSWLTDIVARTNRLGIPGEYFNPNFMPRIARSLNARDMDEYVAMLMRRRARGGVWGFEVTHHQIRAVFGTDAAFAARFADLPAIWLIRRDIVAQGISLAKLASVGVSHAPSIDSQGLARAERAFVYDDAAIRHWIAHIRAAEIGTEALLAATGTEPFRMSYEDNVAAPPHRLVKRIARHVGRGRIRGTGGLEVSPHRRLATAQNTEFAARFRAGQSAWLERIEADRALMLARVEDYWTGPDDTAGTRG